MSDDWTNPGVLSTIRATERQRGWAEAIAALRGEADRRANSGQYGDNGWSMTDAADFLAEQAPKDED